MWKASPGRGGMRAPTLEDVREALRFSADLVCVRDREAFCASLGIDYRNATRYYAAVSGMERSLASTDDVVDQDSAEAEARARRREPSPVAVLAALVAQSVEGFYRMLVFALHLLIADSI